MPQQIQDPLQDQRNEEFYESFLTSAGKDSMQILGHHNAARSLELMTRRRGPLPGGACADKDRQIAVAAYVKTMDHILDSKDASPGAQSMMYRELLVSSYYPDIEKNIVSVISEHMEGIIPSTVKGNKKEVANDIAQRLWDDRKSWKDKSLEECIESIGRTIKDAIGLGINKEAKALVEKMRNSSKNPIQASTRHGQNTSQAQDRGGRF